MSSSCWYGVFHNIFGQTLEIAILALGPFEIWFCRFERFLKNVCVSQWIFLQLCIVITRHIYVFVVKNGANIQHDFWCRFFNWLTVLTSAIFEIVYQHMPGREPINMFVCRGIDPRVYGDQDIKKNYGVQTVILIWCGLYFYSLIQIKIYKWKDPATVTNNPQISHVSSAINQLMKTSPANLFFVSLVLFIFVSSITVVFYVQRLTYLQLNSSPYYQMYHFSLHGVPFLGIGLFIVIYYARHKLFRNAVMCEAKEFVLRTKEKLCWGQ